MKTALFAALSISQSFSKTGWTAHEYLRTLLGFESADNLLRWMIYWSLELRVPGFKYSKAALEPFAKKKALINPIGNDYAATTTGQKP